MSEREEDLLRRAALRKPSDALDARMDKLFSTPHVQRAGVLMRPVRLWHVAVACVACAVAAFAAGLLLRAAPESPQRAVEVRYVLQADQQAFDVFDWTRYPKKVAPCSILKKNRTGTESRNQI
jgi:hypothetical protein